MFPQDKQEPIAIIGAACRLPGQVSALGDLWDMISKEKTGHCKVPEDRWNGDLWHHPDPDRKGGLAVKHGYFLQEDVGKFDAPFFSTTAKEAASLDPMKRLLLEVSYESIENAGIQVEDLFNTETGCYVGCMTNDYEMISLHDIYDLGHAAASATSEAMLANRVSWFYGLKGPSLTLDTACSSSLYALHLACQSLKLRETNMSLVAGVNLIINPNTMHQLSAMHMLSSEGISHTFDSRANGYGRGEGIGCLVVKRLSDALRDGDTIRAVIRNTGVNADGKTVSITQPSPEAQAELIRKTYEEAGLPLASTQYFESHGTGTPVGDPIEMTAIANTIGLARKTQGLSPLWGKLVPTYGVQDLNPKLKLEEWNLALPSETMRWPGRGQRRISVNSFGFGGANAHVISDDAYHYMRNRGMIGNHATVPSDDWNETDSSYSTPGTGTLTPNEQHIDKKMVFVFSAKDKTGIERLASQYATHIAARGLQKQEANFLSHLAYTLFSRRSHHDFRSFVAASSLTELSEQLAAGLPKLKRSSRKDNGNLVFVFTGQGAQWAAMGTQLFSNSIFRNSVYRSRDHLKSLGCSWDAVEELQKTEDSKIAMPEYSQTLCTVLQVALVDVLRQWGVIPKAVVGHSSGEIGAAYAAAYISHEEAVRIAYCRGLSSEQVPTKGAMMAAGISRAEAQVYLDRLAVQGSAVVACVNSPSSVTLSGDVEAIDSLESSISGDGKFARKLKVTTAYHSPHIRKVADGYHEKLGQISTLPGNGHTIMFSSLTGKPVESHQELDAKYWVSNMCAPVEFATAVAAITSYTEQGSGSVRRIPVKWGAFIEIGPHSALQGPVQQSVSTGSNKSAKDAPYLSMLLRGKDAIDTSIKVAGNIWAIGADINLVEVNEIGPLPGHVVPKALTDLPPYPWNHSRSFWHESFIAKSMRFPKAPRTDLLGVPEHMQNSLEPRWRNNLRISENPWIEDHKITGTILYPAAGMLVMALEGALQMADSNRKVRGFRFSEVNFERGLLITSGDDAAVETRLSLLPSDTVSGQFRFTVFSTTTGISWDKHCFGQVKLDYSEGTSEIESSEADPAWIEQLDVFKRLVSAKDAENVEVESFYRHLEGIGMQYGPLFRNVISLTAVASEKASYGTVIIPDTASCMPNNFEYPHVMYPATMDAIFHLVLAAFNGGKPVTEASVPYHIEEMWVAAEQPHGANSRFDGYGHLVSKSTDGHETVGDLIVTDETWSEPKFVVKNFTLRTVSSGEGGSKSATTYQNKCAQIKWADDVDFVQADDEFAAATTAASTATDALCIWVDRILHKRSIHRLLVVVDQASEDAKSILRAVQTRVGQKPGIKSLSVMATCASVQDDLISAGISSDITLLNEKESLIMLESHTYDASLLVGSDVVEGQSDLLQAVKKSLSAHCRLVVVTEASKVAMAKTSLEAAGFTNVLGSEKGLLTALISPKEASDVPAEVHILLPSSASPMALELASNLRKSLLLRGVSAGSTGFSADVVEQLTDKHVISLLEVESPFIYSWGDQDLAAFKSLVSSVKNLFWITRGGQLESWSGGVEFAPAQGLLRVMRNEYPLATISHLDLSPAFDIKRPRSSELVARVWSASLYEDAETEFAELHGAIHVPRAVDAVGLEGELMHYSGVAEPRLTNIRGHSSMLTFSQDSNLWVEDESASRPLDTDEVEIEVDFATISGGLVLANEIVGKILSCGANVKSLSVGQHVIALGVGSLKSRVRQNVRNVAALPSHMSGEGAAALSSGLVTAQYALRTLAGLGAGDRILIHDAESSLGLAAVQLARSVGAELYALVSSSSARDLLVGTYGLSPSQVFDSALTYFISAIRQRTRGAGVDVIFASTLTDAVIPSLSVLADSGSFLDVGVGCDIVLPLSKRNASLLRVNMELVRKSRPALVTELFQAAFGDPKQLISPVTRTIPVSQLASISTVQIQEESESMVVSISANDEVLTVTPPAAPLQLHSDGTYVLAGGLGALGLGLASMLIDHGAKHLVFLSRSGGAKNEEDLEGFRRRGCNAEAFKCNVNDAEAVKGVFDTLRKQGRAIRGIIQAAMVLGDSIFDNMTFDKWTRAFQPKTRGSQNLLSQLSPETNPLFILLSSITGVIGNIAQANYAAGNTFEDALAVYANKHLGIAATSIDVGLVVDSSHFTSSGEFGELEDYLGRYSHGWTGLRCTVDELKVAVVLGLGDEFVHQDATASFLRDQKFVHRLLDAPVADVDGASKGPSVIERLSNAASQAEAAVVVESVLKSLIGAAIGIDAEDVDASKPLPEFGVDSLKAVEIRNHTKKELQSDISVFELLSAVPLADLSIKIASKSMLVKVSEI
ncbi:KR domain-containing protein [Trichoderma breve]|uniref:KR domain-containing protein n=1 Tax=Trichoderma breve TaxID=2034170 RepID=A0A9W9BGA7_9HYPO|nr:KR domain-containing protein [Trichoderma breve]KAJ4859016.1 KR domain-containing protein [Trichoderma breve]